MPLDFVIPAPGCLSLLGSRLLSCLPAARATQGPEIKLECQGPPGLWPTLLLFSAYTGFQQGIKGAW